MVQKLKKNARRARYHIVAVFHTIRNVNANELWQDIKESIAGSDKDFTNVSLSRAILLLSIPMVLEMLMESIFVVVDIFFVSKVGPNAVAAVGITETIVHLVYAIGMGLSAATTALVSRRIGEKKPAEAGAAAFQAIAIGFSISLLISIAGLFFAQDLLELMGAAPEVVEIGTPYTTIMLSGNVVIMLLFIINAVFRSSGDAAISMRVLWLANIINIILDPCLIFGLGPFPALGVKGAAIATTIGRGLAVLYQFYLLFRGSGRIQMKINQLKINFSVMGQIIRLSLWGFWQAFIPTLSWIIMVRIVSLFGSNVLAGYTIAIRIIIFSLLPAWGLGNAAATLVGQNLGAGKPARAEKSVWIAGFINLILLGVVGTFFIIYSEFFISIFINTPQVVREGALCLRVISFGYLSYAFAMIMIQAFNGAGDTTTPTIINFFCFWLLEIPLAWLLAKPLGLKELGVYIAIVVAETIMAFVAIYLFRKGKWKNRQV